MISSRIRRAVAALALAVVLGAPAHATGWHTWTAAPGWLDSAKEWIARLWASSGPTAPEPGRVKADQGIGIDPNGGSSTPPPQQPTTTGSARGAGTDPNQ